MREFYKEWEKVIEFSSETGEGVEELWQVIEQHG
jgi:putative protein kinase ArgK-like GTPase of G3E family